MRGRIFLQSGLTGVVLALTWLARAQPGARADLVAGPLVAGVRPTEAVVWVALRANAAAQLIAQDSATGTARLMVPFRPAAGGTALGHLTGLRPATTYRYHVWLTGQASPTATGSFRTPPADTAVADLTIAVGSCAFVAEPYPTPGYPIFRQIERQHPDVMVWLGDNVYLRDGEWTDSAAAARRYAHTRALPDLQPLLANAAHVAIWDDHDFGFNDADSTLPIREPMLAIFRAYWPADLYATPLGGTTGRLRWGDAEFFLLDNRTWRTPKRGTPKRQRSQLGGAQRAWLLTGLRTSTATFKFVAVGGQVLSTNGRGETFANGFRRERRALLRLLDSAQVKNVVFLTGDRHFGELTVRHPTAAPVQYDLTASPLTAGPAKPRLNGRRVAGTVIRSHNFATVRISGPRGARQLTFTGFDAAGAARWQRTARAQ